jgi:hypothetical protein
VPDSRHITFLAVNTTTELHVNTASQRTASSSLDHNIRIVANQQLLHYMRIELPQSRLTPQQLARLAGMIQHHSPQHGLRLRSPTQLEVAVLAAQRQPRPPERLFILPCTEVPTIATQPQFRIHVPGAYLRVRQLRTLAALMHSEGLRVVRVLDEETLLLENTWPGRAAVLRLGLRDVGLIGV